MDTGHFKRVLLKKQDELHQEIEALRGEVRRTPEGVEDFADEATSTQGKSTSLEENALVAGTLRQVEEALQRIDRGTFGRCVDCGREIEPARLEAVPWTPYCLNDQQKHDRGNTPTGSLTL